jgi:hypothetical protein
VRVNPCLGVGVHNQIIEAEVGGMYAGCGAYPLYVGDGIINGFEEDTVTPYGMAHVVQQSDLIVGVFTNHQCDDPALSDPFLWPRLENAMFGQWAQNASLSETQLFQQLVAHQFGISDPVSAQLFRNITISAMTANLRMATTQVFDVTLLEIDRPSANWYMHDALGGLMQLANDTCNAAVAQHCEVFQYLYANDLFDAALAEKQSAADIYAALYSAGLHLQPAFANATVGTAFIASLEYGKILSAIISNGWQVIAFGYVGDRTGIYNVTAIQTGIEAYDASWTQYRLLPRKYGSLVASLFQDATWSSDSSHVPGLGPSVSKYRNVTTS